MGRPRDLLEEYVAAGKVMQLATVDDRGAPVVCNLWYAFEFAPDRLWFISRPARQHCANLRADRRVAGAILAIELDEVGQAVRGVSFTGTARELPTTGIDDQIRVYAGRWPRAAGAIDPARLAEGVTHHRVYEIEVTDWVLYDEQNFGGQPRQEVAALREPVSR
ncbi:pyridoxamine 5'-phosphate oxidase family protein [Planosporangium sp. 12N6]|uniref:pyridoxamine 5'-phosphate oxidase family protein n=1 Tax=Planosporangium spinosum TaxID=3402278 RepID=UPI003CFA2D5C